MGSTTGLTSLKKEKKSSPLDVDKIATWDIEAENWTEVALVGVYYPHEDHYEDFKTFDEFTDHVFSRRRRGYHYWAHNAGKYDSLLLWKELMKRVDYEFDLLESQGSVVQLTINDSTRERYQWQFHDSIHLINSSLDELTEAYGVDKKKDFDLDKIKQDVDKMAPKDRKKLREYLERDCKGLWQVLEKFKSQIEDFGGVVGLTRASTAMKTWRSSFWPDGLEEIPNYRKWETEIKKAYHGGRTEVFRKAGKDIKVYDINSLYPDRMMAPLPIGYPKYKEDFSLEGIDGVVKARVKTPDQFIPILPVVEKVSGAEKLIFPVGEMTDVWDSEELKFAVENGYEIKRLKWAIDFPERYPVFRKYVRKLYDEKTELKKQGDKGARYNAIKVLLNSLYGKTAMQRQQASVVHHPSADTIQKALKNGEDIIPFDEENGLYKFLGETDAHYITPMLATRITALARIKLWEVLNRYSQHVYYCDTDSVFLDTDLDPELVDPYELGAWDLEAELEEAYFLAAKLYAGRKKDGGIKRGHKGLKSSDELDFQSFKRAYEQQDGSHLHVEWESPGGWRSSYEKTKKPIAVFRQEREPKFENHKRLWFGDSSLPLRDYEGEIMSEQDEGVEVEYQKTEADRIYDFLRSRGLNISKGDVYWTEFKEELSFGKRMHLTGNGGLGIDEVADKFGLGPGEVIRKLAKATPLNDRVADAEKELKRRRNAKMEEAFNVFQQMVDGLQLTDGSFYWPVFRNQLDYSVQKKLLSDNGKSLGKWADEFGYYPRKLIDLLSEVEAEDLEMEYDFGHAEYQ